MEQVYCILYCTVYIMYVLYNVQFCDEFKWGGGVHNKKICYEIFQAHNTESYNIFNVATKKYKRNESDSP